MKYAKIENNIVVQIQPHKEHGFIEVSDSVVCGQIKKDDGKFDNPDIVLNKEDLLYQEKQECKQYLIDTGWIWDKYTRNVTILKTLSEDEFTAKYNDIIQGQESKRLRINEIEKEMESL